MPAQAMLERQGLKYQGSILGFVAKLKEGHGVARCIAGVPIDVTDQACPYLNQLTDLAA